MDINISNYGGWFLDYHEGTLSAEKVAELFLFLEQHPELRDEFESFTMITIPPPEAVNFPGKELLKKGAVNTANIDEWLIAEMEGDLNLQERIKLNDFLKSNPGYQKERELYSLCKLDGGNEVYPDKKSLKIKIVNPYVQRIRTFAAAAIIILMLGVLYINENSTTNESQTARVENQENTATTPSSTPSPSSAITETPSVQSNASKDEMPQVFTDSQQPLVADEVEDKPVRKNTVRENVERNEPVQLAERKEIHVVHIITEEAEPIAATIPVNTQQQDAVNASLARTDAGKGGLNEKLSNLKDKAAGKINEATGEELLYSQNEIADSGSGKIPLKSRLVKFVAWSVSKISGNKVIMEPTFDASGNLAAYQVSAGKFKYERDF